MISSTLLRGLRMLLPLGLALGAGLAPAEVVLQVDRGKLTGATGVVVDGALYDVAFRDGSCRSLFGGCRATSIAFHDADDAKAASLALLDQVFVDIAGGGQFDSSPMTTRGCRSVFICSAYTPYAIDRLVNLFEAQNGRRDDDGVERWTSLPTFDTGRASVLVWAVWTPHADADRTVPEPSTLALMSAAGLGLVGLRGRGRRGRVQRGPVVSQ